MRKIAIAGFVALALSAALAAQEPTREHEWLHRLAGQWEADLEVVAAPGQPPLQVKATETTRRIGKLWIVTEGEAKRAAMPFARSLTLGYDPAGKKYVGTWVDSTSTYIGRYEGTMDEAGKKLTLEGEMPHPY